MNPPLLLIFRLDLRQWPGSRKLPYDVSLRLAVGTSSIMKASLTEFPFDETDKAIDTRHGG
jgi:hypothetical protein